MINFKILLLTIYEEEQLDYWVWGPATRAVTWRRPTQMAQFNHTGETNNLDGDLSITILYTHMYTHAHTHIPVVLQIAHHHIHIYIYIDMCYVSPHRVKYLFYRTDSPPLCIHIYTYILCFTTQSWHLFYLTDGPVLPHWVSQQSGWWLIYHHLIHPYVHTYTPIYCLFYR